MRSTVGRRRRWLAIPALVALSVAAPPVLASLGEAPPPEPAVAEPAPAEPEGRWGDFVSPTDTVLVVRQPDGTEFRARLTDAEVGGAMEAAGYTVVQGDDGWWRYASGRDGDGLVASSALAGIDAPPAGVPLGAGRIPGAWSDGEGGDTRAQILRQLQVASAQASAAAAAAGEPRVFRFPVVLFATWYDEEAGQTEPQFQEGNGVEHYEAILDGFGGNPTGTLTEFYFENSYGQFLVEVDVLAQPDGSPYVSNRSRSPLDGRCYYGGIDPPEDPLDDADPIDSALGVGGGGALGMAIELFNSTTLAVDHPFDAYDNDGDGAVDFMGIIHSGPEMAVSGDPCHTWSHAISVSTFGDLAGTLLTEAGLPIPATGVALGLPIPGQPGLTYDRLFTMPEFETPTGVLTIGVAAHEMAHALGEPDYYGTNGSSPGSGDWDVMSGGSYGGTPSGSNPTWFNPATRVFQGWVTPTIVHEDALDVTLGRRSEQPSPDYAVGQPNPNLVLVPTRWVQEGETTEDGHTWTAEDVFGLVEDGVGEDDEPRYVIEGWYLELGSRMPTRAAAIHPEMTRESYFDRWLYGSGLLTWHFDYWRRSNVLFGQNGANDDPNRLQMDVEEWDFNDNTQELALNLNRAEASDVAWDAATGITSGTHQPNPAVGPIGGEPQPPIELATGGPITPLTPHDAEFEVLPGFDNRTMRVVVNTDLVGDCTLQLLSGPAGQEVPETEVIDAGGPGAPETAIVTAPAPGRWVARVGEFAGCAFASGEVTFESSSGFDATGTADTWSNETEAPTGWAFTNIRTGLAEGLAHGTDAGGDGTLTLDIVHLGEAELDVSPGFARPALNDRDGRGGVVAGQPNAMEVDVFANGGAPRDDVPVEVRLGSPDGVLVHAGTVDLTGYDRATLPFTFDPGHEGGYDLFTIVDPLGALDEELEGNNVQKSSGWAGPASPTVLLVDDDGPGDTERVYAGALAALGIPYAIAERHVAATVMDDFAAVIWVSTLDRSEGQLDEADREQIAEYLGAGGKLWLSSNRAVEAVTAGEAPEFVEQWFGVTSVDIDSYYEPVQFLTADILDGTDLTIEVLPGRPFVDKYALADAVFGTATSLGVLDGSGTPADGEAILGARVQGALEGGGTFETVVNSFNLAQVSDPDAAIGMVEAVMENFEVDGSYTVRSPIGEPIVYHAQPRQTVAGVALPVRATVLGGRGANGQGPAFPVTLFYRHHGIGDYVALPMQAIGDRGGHLATIPAVDVTPDGIDYFIRAGAASTFEPRAAATGDLAAAVAVFMPEVVVPTAPQEPAAPPAPAPAPIAAPAPAPAAPAAPRGATLPATGGGTPAAGLAAGALVLAVVARRVSAGGTPPRRPAAPRPARRR